jgi:epoxyqueuosine reductase QueG
MTNCSVALETSIANAVSHIVAHAGTTTAYREPLVGFADADDPRFEELCRVADPEHMMPEDLLPGARSVISFFVPFDPRVVEANARDRSSVADEWAIAYVETNELIGQITDRLIALLTARGIGAAAEPATGNFDADSLASRWSHKSVAVIAGLGSFGRHHMIITDAGCAGRLGSLVTDVQLASAPPEQRERCLYVHDGSCLACVQRCPLDALSEDEGIDKRRCWSRCLSVAKSFEHLGHAQVCGKCAIGPCSFEAPVR